MQTGTRWLASLVIPLLLQVAACSGGSEDSGNGAPQGGGLALVISRTEIEPNTEESFTGCMTPDVLGFLNPGEQLEVFGLVGGGDSDAFAIAFPVNAEITATLFILGNAELAPGSPAYDESRVVRITLYESVDGRFDHDINGSLIELGRSQAGVGFPGDVRTLGFGTLAVGLTGGNTGPYVLVVEAR